MRFFFVSAFPVFDRAYAVGRFMTLMNSARRRRLAVQSSSIAIMRTVSKPAAPNAFHPSSRFSSLVYRFELAFGYANHRRPSPSTSGGSDLASASTSASRVTNASVNETCLTPLRLRFTITPSRRASSDSKLSGALSTTISP